KMPEEEQDSLAAFSRIEANITQYDPLLDNAGKSACTCICLKAAEMLLEASPDQVNAGLIDDILVEGVADYNRFKVGGVVEHTSVENYELNTFELKRLEFRDVDNPFSAEGNPYAGTLDSFAKMMEKASDSKDLPKPVALVMTKSNMTITIVIRPDGKYWLFDPHGTNGKGAYIESCNTDELIKKIKEIFPKTSYPGMTEDENLGFNSFEAYAVRR
nr:Chain A, Wc-VDT1 [Waddlia chondrophila]